MLFDLNKAYREFNRNVRFAELTEDDIELNKAYSFATKNAPTSPVVKELIKTAVAKLEKGKGTRGAALWKKNMPEDLWNVLYYLIWDKYNVDVSESGLPRWSLPKDEVDKKVKFNENWRKKVRTLYFAEIEKRKKELGK